MRALNSFRLLSQPTQKVQNSRLVRASLEAADSTKGRFERVKPKMDTRKYKPSDLYGTPRDPALRQEMDDSIKAHKPPKGVRMEARCRWPVTTGSGPRAGGRRDSR